jgi:hypothetical protein
VIGQLGGLIPLPGGVGGTDGGLIGAMVLYGASLSRAAAAVVVYRTFQLGITAILGAIAFVQLRRTLRDSDELRAVRPPRRVRGVRSHGSLTGNAMIIAWAGSAMPLNSSRSTSSVSTTFR